MLALKPYLQAAGISQARLAAAVGVSPATMAQLLNHEQWPTTPAPEYFELSIVKALRGMGQTSIQAALFEPVPTAPTAGTDPSAPLRVRAAADTHTDSARLLSGVEVLTEEVENMLLERITLKQPELKHFGLFANPFDDDVNEPDDVYIDGREQRYAYESLRACWKNQGFTALVGESGSGKTTLKDRMLDDLRHENVAVIAPGVTEMDDEKDKRGRPLTMTDINDAIVATLTPGKTLRRGSQARQRQVKEALVTSSRAGYKNLLIIEEAHQLRTQTMRQLKRLREEKDGTRLLLGVLLIGQPGLADNLSMRMNWDAREVIQRCEVVTLSSLGADLEAYLRFKFERVGKGLNDIFEPGATDAIRERLLVTKTRGKQSEQVSLLYPLAINNLAASAMKMAADFGFKTVSADIVREA